MTGKALLHQQRDAPGVVNVGVGHQYIVNIAGGKVQSIVVMFIPALLQAAVDENFLAPHFQTVAAAGDRVSGDEECEFNTGTSCLQFGKPELLPAPGADSKIIHLTGVIVHCFPGKFHSYL